MGIRSDFEKEFEDAFRIGVGHYGITLENYKELGFWAALWALKKAEEECMSPTAKGRILALTKELGEVSD